MAQGFRGLMVHPLQLLEGYWGALSQAGPGEGADSAQVAALGCHWLQVSLAVRRRRSFEN